MCENLVFSLSKRLFCSVTAPNRSKPKGRGAETALSKAAPALQSSCKFPGTPASFKIRC